MDTMKAFCLNRATPDGHEKVFDWDKAAQIIKERKPDVAYAGLSEDWEWTSGLIYENGEPAKSYAYLYSRWATPVLVLDFDEIIECNQPEGYHGWDADTSWPESALEILKGE